MRLPKIMSRAEPKGWTKLDVTVQAAIIAGIFAAVGAAMTTYSGYVATSQTIMMSCVKRLDDQEDKLRARAETLLTSIGKLLAYPGHPNPTAEGLADRYDTAIVAGHSLIASAPPALAVKTMHLIGSLMQVSNPTGNSAEDNKQQRQFQESINPWHQAYFDELTHFETDRKGC